MSRTFVYFIRPIGHGGPLKIGSTKRLDDRLEQLSRASPLPLEVAATALCDCKTEKTLHRIFAADYSHGEWFNSTPRLRELIAKLADGVPLAEAIDLTGPAARGPLPYPSGPTKYLRPIETKGLPRHEQHGPAD